MRMKKEISVFNAKTHFSGLIDRVYTQHETVIITRRGIKVAKIVPFEQTDEKKVAAVLRELKALNDEIGCVGMTQQDIKKMKEEGRK
ncbi:MAG: hypothetical protein ACD_60C00118G0011 [uncultured bacterium]|nr:MAG: hypothetical protein ACD_60C00118G0011 [uncultured bacterium]